MNIFFLIYWDSAADLYITKHLHAFVTKGGGKNLRILRLNAKERRLNTVPDEVLAFCYFTDSKVFEIPSKQEIASYHLVLTTVENSIVLSSLDMHGCFTHIFVDEAGQVSVFEELIFLLRVNLGKGESTNFLTYHQIVEQILMV